MRINPCLVLRTVSNHCFLIPVRKNEISKEPMYINEVGAYILRNISSCLDNNILMQNTAEHFNIGSDEEAIESVAEFLEELVSSRILIEDEVLV
ncbi:MAG: PqqD family peptide modification chaperone [Oscillospiraceae bacterium]|nr:PqqD family peptide modification chaperone [Oscillospiraceae bacterium]